MVRAHGSYPWRPGFKSLLRHLSGSNRTAFFLWQQMNEILETDELLTIVIDFFSKGNVFSLNDRYVLAHSGGLDSSVLFHLLMRILPDPAKQLVVAHLDHAFRTGSQIEKKILQQQVTAQGIQFFAQRIESPIPKGISKETFWRTFRYDFLENIRQQSCSDFILTAHHADDNLESMILRFSTGCGPRGLLGIQEVKMQVIRPMLHCSRVAIDSYAKKHQLVFFSDPTNLDCTHIRNRIRKYITPELKKLNPQIHSAISKLQSILKDEDDFMSDSAVQILKKLEYKGNFPIVFPLNKTISLHIALKRRIALILLNTALAPEPFFRYSNLHINLMCRFFSGTLRELNLFNILIGYCRHEKLYLFLKNSIPKQMASRIPLKIPGMTVLNWGTISTSQRTTASGFQKNNFISQDISLAKISKPFFVRTPIKNDCFHPLGMKQTLNLIGYLSNKGIPSELRYCFPIIVDSRNQIIVIPKIAISEKARISKLGEVTLNIKWKYNT